MALVAAKWQPNGPVILKLLLPSQLECTCIHSSVGVVDVLPSPVLALVAPIGPVILKLLIPSQLVCTCIHFAVELVDVVLSPLWHWWLPSSNPMAQ